MRFDRVFCRGFIGLHDLAVELYDFEDGELLLSVNELIEKDECGIQSAHHLIDANRMAIDLGFCS